MIAWWGWMLIWTGLVVAMLAMLALFAWWLFRKFLVLVDDVADLADKSVVLDVDEPQLVKPQIAILAELSDIRAREAARRAHRANRRSARHERRLERARVISSVDVLATRWPEEWYR